MSLLADLMEQVKPAQEPVEEPKQEQEEITLDGFIQLQKALRQMEKEEAQPFQEEISQLESKAAAEQAIVDAYMSYDVAKASKEPDFDRNAASTMAANADVASQILAGLESDLDVARQRVSDIHAEYGRKAVVLRNHGDNMDQTRRAVAIEYARAGRLRLDKDHAARWLKTYVHARNWMEQTFGEKYQDAVDYCLEQLSSYAIPTSTTAMLFEHCGKRDQESLQQFNPEGTNQHVNR